MAEKYKSNKRKAFAVTLGRTSISLYFFITATHGFSAKTPIETIHNQKAEINGSYLQINDQQIHLISHMGNSNDSDEIEEVSSTTDEKSSTSTSQSSGMMGGSMMWVILAMCCCLPLCAYMYMRNRRNSQQMMQGDGFRRVGGHNDGWDSDDEYGRRGQLPPGARYVVVQRGGGQGGGFGGGGAGVPIGGYGGGQGG